ncbi:outer membrane protein [Granulicella sp. S156]|jgi:hypothetical protein|uniref:outer membrane protein n=1 Tax=Granulicella sp. S156 TaxID=1747224 RepID=UPI00131E12BB|nr:hypothetical protein [Granulicella sp. S156]
MCDVRKSVVRLVVMGLAAGVFSGALATANAQKNKKQQHARRETNASREARIQRTINYTYSHRWEVFGGGGYLRFRSGDYLKKNNEVTWATAANYYLNPKFAIVGDVRGSFGNAHPLLNNDNFQSQAPNPQINEYTFMGGANYRFYAKEKVALSLEGLGGVGWGIFSGGAKGLTGPQIGIWQDGFKPAFSVGLNVDYNVYPNIAVRFTPTYVATTFSSLNVTTNKSTGVIQNNLGFNAGIVYRFGHK